MNKCRILLLSLILIVLSTCIVFGQTMNIPTKANHPTYVQTNQCYTELNKYRVKFNKGKKKSKRIKSLKRSTSLEKIAKIRAREIATTGKFSHTRPNGKSGLTLIKGHKAKGENIAMGQIDAIEVTTDWYNSAGHRANMLRKKFHKVGIAAYEYHGITYWVQIYSS